MFLYGSFVVKSIFHKKIHLSSEQLINLFPSLLKSIHQTVLLCSFNLLILTKSSLISSYFQTFIQSSKEEENKTSSLGENLTHLISCS